MAVRRLGQIFVDLGFITDDQLEMLVEEQSQNYELEDIAAILEDNGFEPVAFMLGPSLD